MSSQPLERQKALLRLEYEYEKNEFEQTTKHGGVGRLVKRGDCWLPCKAGRSWYNSMDRLAVEITRTEDTDIEHNFEYGRTVCFFVSDYWGRLRYLPFRATVSYAEKDRMVVILPDEQALQRLQDTGTDSLGVQLFFDETTYRLMFEALYKVIAAKEGRLWELREIFHSDRPLQRPLSLPTVSLPWLNASQQKAVNMVLCAKDCAVVHGPPGTGKTTTMVEAIGEVLKRETQVMVCAQSNMAVDWIARQLHERGYNVLRIGNPTRVTEGMLSFTYERRFEAHPDYPALWNIRRTIRQLRSARGRKGEAIHQKISRLKDRAEDLEFRIRSDLFNQCRIVACTLAGSANPILYGQHFHTLFIDEAAQALEAACWIAIRRADRVILAGDHQQLPPTIKSPKALEGGLGRTLMEQIVKNKPECVSLLTVQYRMNEELMLFSSEWFYGGKLQAAPEVRHRSLLDELDSPLVWVDSDAAVATADKAVSEGSGNALENEGTDAAQTWGEEFSGNNYGRINKAEAALTMRVLRNYVERVSMRRIIDERIDFGVISPYRAQVQYLRRLLRTDKEFHPIRNAITVNTVDSFQGQERDVVIISLVRANEAGQIGFLRDLRRMNVAMTRARMKLIIIGSASTLCRHRFYKELYKRCHKE